MTQQPGWYPASLAGGVETGTSTGTRLLGEEIVIWRDATGAPHVWEDRCPHRGMRLSMGFVRSDRIACLYHGWQYGTDGRCLHIPAHPDIQVPPTIITWRHSCREAIGLIWIHFGEAATEPALPAEVAGRVVVPVRSVYIDRPAELVAAQFVATEPPPFRAGPATVSCSSRQEGPLTIHTLRGSRFTETLIGALQPIDATRSALHLVIVGDGKDYRGAGQLHFSRFAEAFRDSIESGIAIPASELHAAYA